MANKNNNKGFSLIELVIAVAILSILLAPIIIQITQTLNTSAKAKEKQYVVENAEYVLEYFKKSSEAELLSGSSDISVVNMTGNVECYCSAVTAGASPIAIVDYNLSVYQLDDKQLGKKHNTYSRTVTVDDLSNNLLDKDVVPMVEFTADQENQLKALGYEKTSEGTYVQYRTGSANGVDFKYVNQIVCKPRPDTSYVNPNKASLGYIQDLDATKVAIIQGDASDMDSQIEKEFYGKKMNHLKELNYTAWEAAMSSVTGENVFSNNVYGETLSKMTKLSITSGLDASTGMRYYDVACDVYYEDSYTLYSNDIDDSLSYNVFGQRFYTDKAPDIFFIYEPFVTVSTSLSMQYATNDYISIYSDDDSTEAKVYLIQPGNTQFTAKGLGYTGTDSDKAAYWHKVSGTVYKPVKIHVNKIGNNMLNIYTNLETGAILDMTSMFDVAVTSAVPSMTLPTGTARGDYDANYIKPLSDDIRYSERLFTVTVNLSCGDGSDTTFTGAKGEN